MKAIAIGLGMGIFTMLVLVKLSSRADADCEGCTGSAGFSSLAADLNVDNNTDRNFSDDGALEWCKANYEPTAGAAEVEGTPDNLN